MGQYGRVLLTSKKNDVNSRFAIKVLNKDKLKQVENGTNNSSVGSINSKIRCFRKLSHPNIVRYYETYSDQKHIYLVMEHVIG